MTKNTALDSFDSYFGGIQDPRKPKGLLHKLRDIMIIGILWVHFKTSRDVKKSYLV